MQITKHGLKKPEEDTFYDIEDFNYNTDILEEHLDNDQLHVNATDIAKITETTTLSQIDETDTNVTMWGKVKKAISTLVSHITNVATESTLGHIKLSDNYTSLAGAAAVGVGASSKAINDVYNELNTNLELLKTDVDTLKGKFKSQPIGANSFRYLNFSGIFSCIITVDGVNGQSFGSFIVNGYGISSARIHVTKLQAGSPVTLHHFRRQRNNLCHKPIRCRECNKRIYVIRYTPRIHPQLIFI